MDFQLINPHKVKVTLDSADMQHLGVTYDSLDYLDPQTKKMLLSILQEAKVLLGFDTKNTRLFVEAFPEEKGGCTLYLTGICSKEPSMPKEVKSGVCGGPILFRFDNFEVLLTAAQKLFCRCGHRVYKSSLFRLEQQYLLVVSSFDKEDRLVPHFLCEYADLVGEGDVATAFVEEHGVVLIAQNAIDVLSQYAV